MANPARGPRVSVLVPAYEHAPFIRETLDSVLAQDYGDFHVVVGDDGSQDGTADVVTEHVGGDPRVRLLRSERNLGLAANFNRLLGAVEGEYYAWLGGDDVMLPGKLSQQVALLEARPDAVGCVHDAEVFVSETGETLGRFSEMYNGRRGFREGGVELWFEPLYFMLPSTMMIRSSARPARGYDERLPFANESLFDIETFRRGPCVTLDAVLVRYRRHGGNVRRSAAMQTGILEESLMAMAMVQARHPELTGLVRRRRASLLLSAAMRSAGQGERRAAARYGWAALTDGGPRGVAASVAAYARLRAGRRRLGAAAPV
ncbi:MAG: hypothetical protein QOF29_3235 [bacterium]